MKKNRPSFSPHSSVQELIKRYDETARQSSTVKSHHATIVFKSKKSVPIKEDKEALLLEENAISNSSSDTEYTRASAITKNSTETLMKEKSSENEQQETIVHTTTASHRTISALSQTEITQLIAHNKWLRAYKEEVFYWSKEAFGKRHILQEKISEIQRNPALEEDLSWQLAAHPERICKLPGINICGIKNKTRKKAERCLTILCATIDRYRESVRSARESLLQSPQIELKRYEELIGNEKISQILRSSHHPGKGKQFLVSTEITCIAQRDSTVKSHQAQIIHWSRVVFGKSDILQGKIESVLSDPSTGTELIQQLTENPRSFYKLSGINICGLKNKARKNAEENLSQLVGSVNNFVDAVKQARKNILQDYQAQQECRKPFTELAENLSKQQDLSKSSECLLLADERHEIPETSRQSRERMQSVQPRKAPRTKTLALAS